MLVRKSVRQVSFVLLTAALALSSCNIGATPAPTIDVNALSTASFSTAVAYMAGIQTQTALAAPSATPTNTPLALPSLPAATAGGAAVPGNPTVLPTFSFNNNPNTTPAAGLTPIGTPAVPVQQVATAALGDACSNNQFVADITIPDGTVFEAGNPKGLRPGDDFKKVWRVKNTGSCKWDDGFTLVFVGGDTGLDPVSVKLIQGNFVNSGDTADVGVPLTAPTVAGKYTATWRMQNDKGQFFGTPLTVVIEVRKH